MSRIPLAGRAALRPALAALAVAALAATAPALAQPTTPALPADRIVSGTAAYVYTEPGAPLMEIVIVRQGGGGLYRVAEETTLTELLALSGGTAPPDQTTSEVIQTSTIRVLRPSGDTRTVIYEAAPERLLREPGRHPALADGDVVEVVTTVEERPRRTTFAERLNIVTSIASVVSLVVLLAQNL